MILSFILSSSRTERPIVAVKLINTENRNSVAAAIPISAGDGEPLHFTINSKIATPIKQETAVIKLHKSTETCRLGSCWCLGTVRD